MTAVWGLYSAHAALLSIIGYGLIASVLFRLVCNLCVYIDEKFKSRRLLRKSSKLKEPNILWEYMKAKKAKVCPVLTFETKE
jgi:hypothetical protein